MSRPCRPPSPNICSNYRRRVRQNPRSAEHSRPVDGPEDRQALRAARGGLRRRRKVPLPAAATSPSLWAHASAKIALLPSFRTLAVRTNESPARPPPGVDALISRLTQLSEGGSAEWIAMLI